jgi:hypothetical protein
VKKFILGDNLEPLEIIKVLDREKLHLGRQNAPKSLGIEKLLKIVNFKKTVLR